MLTARLSEGFVPASVLRPGAASRWVAAGILWWTTAAAATDMVFPARDWPAAEPATQGIDAHRLQVAIDYLLQQTSSDGANRLMLIRNGRSVFAGARAHRWQPVWSVNKVFLSTVLGVLTDEGRCHLDSLASEFVPELAQNFGDVTLRHFATMTSGYFAVGDDPRRSYTNGPSETPFLPGPEPLFAPPGSHYAYWDSAMNELGYVLTRVAGEPVEKVFRRRVAGRIGIRRFDWKHIETVDGLEVNGGAGGANSGVQVSAQDLARLGHLFLNGGRWGDEQVLSRDWVAAATSVQVPPDTPLGPHALTGQYDGRGVYGYGWWVNGERPDGRRKWPDAPAGTFAAIGRSNNWLFVVPEWQLVIARLWGGEQGEIGDDGLNEWLRLIGDAVIDGHAGRGAGHQGNAGDKTGRGAQDLPRIVDGYPGIVQDDGAARYGWSVRPGERLTFFLNATHAGNYPLEIRNVAGDLIASVETRVEPQVIPDDNPWGDGVGYRPAASWEVPSDVDSGVYFINRRDDLFFVVTERTPSKPIVVLLPTNTMNARSTTRDISLFSDPSAHYVSFLRPFSFVMTDEWRPLLSWLHGDPAYHGRVAVITDREMGDYANLAAAEVLIVAGRSEFWDLPSRRHFDRFVHEGGDAIVAGASTMSWQMRLEPGENRMTSHRVTTETWGRDPVQDYSLKTGPWNHPWIAYPGERSVGGGNWNGGERSPGARFSWGGFAVLNPESPLLAGLGFETCDLFPVNAPAIYDGMPVLGLDRDGFPIPDLEAIGAYRAEILAYDWGHAGEQHTIGTMHVMQHNPGSGVVLHLGSNRCCTDFDRADSRMRRIMASALDQFIAGGDVFLNHPPPEVYFEMQTPSTCSAPLGIGERCGFLRTNSMVPVVVKPAGPVCN